MSDNDSSSANEQSRRREDAAIRTEQKLIDFMGKYAEDRQRDEDRYQSDRKASGEWRKTIEDKVKILDTLTTPMRIVGASFILMVTPILGVLGWDIGRWLAHRMDILFK